MSERQNRCDTAHMNPLNGVPCKEFYFGSERIAE